MAFRILLACLLVVLSSSAFCSDSLSTLDEHNVSLSLYDGGVFSHAQESDNYTATIDAPDNPYRFIQALKQAQTVDRVSGGSYWLYHRVKNDTKIKRWVLEPYDAIIDTVQIYIYKNGQVETIKTGYLHDNQFNFSYAVELELQQGETAEFLIFIQSRYFSGNPKFELKSDKEFTLQNSYQNMLLVACFGAIVILAFYNFFLGIWIKDKSYLYYSAYLLLSVIAWLAAFNAFSQWFNIHGYWSLLPPFYLLIAFNTLYIIHFLNLPEEKPVLVKWLYGLVLFCFVMVFSLPMFTMGQYMIIHSLTSACWIVVALCSGVVRLNEGFKAARFFVLAFAILTIGILYTLLPIVIPSIELKNSYLVSLVTQTFDMLLLSLALADRINVLRSDKELTLSKLVDTEAWAIGKEKEANTKLQQALTISEEESQRKSDFLRMVSHELRTPLYSIISSVEQWDDIDNEQGQKDLLEYMSYGAARLRMQVDNLVLLAETDSSDLEPANSPFELRPMLENLSENVNGLLNPGVDFEYSCTDSVPSTFMGDAYLIEHMFRTVLENACKYTEHGKIGFYAQWLDDALVVKIIDTGCGMTREQERTMFNDFIQVSRGLERNSEGLGIGLTVCYRLANVLNADLNIKTVLGEGTEVVFEVPLETYSISLSSPRPDRIEQAEVLIVEDNTVNAQILCSLVQLMGAVATIVDSGQAALALLDERGFDMILMDIQMPVMDGITATRWIRRRNHFMPIVAVTANSDANVRKRCIEVGMNDFLVKPIRRSDLQRVMERQLLDKKTL